MTLDAAYPMPELAPREKHVSDLEKVGVVLDNVGEGRGFVRRSGWVPVISTTTVLADIVVDNNIAV